MTVDDDPPAFVADVLDTTTEMTAASTCIVDEDIKLSESLGGGFNDGMSALRLRHITGHSYGFKAFLAEQFDRIIRAIRIQVIDYQANTFAGQRPRLGHTQASGTSGDQCNATANLQIHRNYPFTAPALMP